MIECKVCGKKFKTMQALGGHVRNAHPQDSNAAAGPSAGKEEKVEGPVSGEPAEEGRQLSTQEAASVDEEPSRQQEIEALLKEGYTPEQLKKEWGLPRQTVDDIARKVIPPKGSPQGTPRETPTLPVVLKAGQNKEVVNPDAILQQFLQADGDAGAWMMKGFMLYRAAQLAVMSDVEIMKGQADAQAAAIKPYLDIMEQAREDMDAAAQRARESTEQIAHQAAGEAAAMAAMRIDERLNQMQEKKKDIAEVQDPMKGLMARTMEMVINQITGQLFGGGQTGTGMPPGWEDKRGIGGK